jgi:catechol 2,3-dioxygenase-like lactoylglutathione lyase family enzyme
MFLRHIALTCNSEENADKFYRDLLGLKKTETKTLPADLSEAIFNLDVQMKIINYLDENVHFEIFITGRIDKSATQIAHSCLEVDNRTGFIEKCAKMGVDISQIPKADATLTFIRDYDGNLFEIKQP